jgi:hypothetical protein
MRIDANGCESHAFVASWHGDFRRCSRRID